MCGDQRPRSILQIVLLGFLIGFTAGCADLPIEVNTGIAIQDVSFVDVISGERSYRAKAVGIDADGALLLERRGGKAERLLAGDVGLRLD